MTLTAEELYRRGLEHSNAGRHAAARTALGAAAARACEPDLRARITGTLAYVMARTGEPERAAHLCREALAADAVSAATAAVLRGQLGAIALQSGDFDGAREQLDQAIAAIGDQPALRAGMHLNRSVADMQQGRLEEARAHLRQAERDFDSAGMEHDAAMAVHNDGYVALLSGDLVAALAAMDRARRVLGGDSSVNGAICDVDRAEVLRDAGLPRDAERILAEAARTLGAHGMRHARAEAEYHLARSLLGHDRTAAARTARAAARRFGALGSAGWAARAEAVRHRALLADGVPGARGVVRSGGGRAPSGEAVGATAMALDAAGFARDAEALRAAAELRRARDGQPASRPLRMPPGATLDVRLLTREVRVARASAAGRDAQVRREAAAGIDELAGWQASFGSLDLQSAVTMHGLPLMMAGLSAAMRSHRPEVLFDWAERARHFGSRVVPVRPPPDAALAADLAELRMLRMQEPGGDWLATPAARELQARVRSRQWASTRSGGVVERASLAEVQAGLDPDTAMLAYAWSEGKLACVVVTTGGAQIVDLPEWQSVQAALPGLRADLDVSASVRSGPIADVVRRSLDGRLATVSRSLLAAPAAAAGARRLVLTTPGVLAGIPWGMLPDMRGRVFTQTVSATRWTRLGRERPAPTRAGVATGPRIARGVEEAAAVAAAWEGRAVVVEGAEATVDTVTALAGDVPVLHVAAHGRHASDNPLFSGLELADGVLFGYDIDRIAHLPQTVVLSACEVGRSSVRWGEEAVGMTRTWLHAGARCVVAAPIVVADDVACELLGALHDGLAAGQDPAEALAAASERTGIASPFACHGAGF